MTPFGELPDPFDDTVDDVPFDEAEAETTLPASCPYCGEEVEILVDAGGGDDQEYVEDCEVCCRPWTVRLRWFGSEPVVELHTEDD